jgi:NADH/NAD ratio-sensing transcriptional regulator Rex
MVTSPPSANSVKTPRPEIPRKVIYRLSVYLRCLQRLKNNALRTVSSEALAKAAGVLGILNFTPVVLQVPEDVMVNNVNLAIELENLSYFIQD